MKSLKGEYCKIICHHADEYLQEIVDFANMVFGMSYGCIDFLELYPKAYSDGRCGRVTHHLIKEKSRIKALVDSYPLELSLGRAGEGKLKAVYIGTVAVHPGARGRGYMTTLMEYAEKDALRQGCALMIVDGNRHRYQPFGYERAGIRYCFFVGRDNIRHCCPDGAGAYRFEESDEKSPYLRQMYDMYCKRNVTARTFDDFLPCLRSEKSAVYAVLRGNEFAGYVNLSAEEDKILEFELDNVSGLAQVVCALMDEFCCEGLMIAVGADEISKTECLEKICDYCQMSMSHLIRILDYEAVLSFLFGWKQKYKTLGTGEYIVGIRRKKENTACHYLISVSSAGVRVSETDRDADAVYDEDEFVRRMTTNLFYPGHGTDKAPAGWFPLPFYLPDADAF